jgi:hypothetical protein
MDISHGETGHKNGSRPNRKHFILMESRNLWNIGPNASKSMEKCSKIINV